jgi:hypothetical protein
MMFFLEVIVKLLRIRTCDALSLNHSILYFIIMYVYTCNYNKFVDDTKVRSAVNLIKYISTSQNHMLCLQYQNKDDHWHFDA